MRKLSFFLVLLMSSFLARAQSPHGGDFKMDCANCHSSESWELIKGDMIFNHKQTDFDLTGQHELTDCKACHTTLKFSTAQQDCFACHIDRHSNTLGKDCARCHTTASWLVANERQIHELSRFPLLGSHATADCYSCHESASNLEFEPLGVECLDCHMTDYMATTAPNHQVSGYSTNCTDCHSARAVGWGSSNIEHNFFPLESAHAISCVECHVSGTFEKISNDCFSCHQLDYSTAQSPNHQQLNFSTNCQDCHTLNAGWEPAEYRDHDAQFFPIYSGEHRGEWNNCMDCHTQSASFTEFSCIACHEHNQSETDDEHQGIDGYNYRSNLCYTCHPTGRESGAFNHGSTGFPLLGVHSATDCASCHTSGYEGTSSACIDCHQPDYNQATNPSHQNLALATTCADCHTSDPGWQPADFPVHNDYYPLTGAHAVISTDCVSCHEGNYAMTDNTCYACHDAEYNSTTNPNHVSSDYPTDCASCHSTNNWEGAAFNHDLTGFVLTGAHTTSSCVDCHAGDYTNTPNTCYGCHDNDYNATSDPNHVAANFPTDCESCHGTNAWDPSTFNHDAQYFPIYSGEHREEWSSCTDCHTIVSNYSEYSCINCHEHDQASMDDKHSDVNDYSYNSASCLACHPQGNED